MTHNPHLARRTRGGPALAPVMGICLALFLASLVVPAVVTGGTPYPSPQRPPSALTAYLDDHAGALRLTALFQFAAAVPLVVFGAAATAQLRRIGVRVAGPVIGLAGAMVASIAMATAALVQWTLTRLEPDAPIAVLTALRDLAFITGGPWHTVGLGLLVAGIAVPGLAFRLLPRWLAWAGVVIAVICELTTLTLLVDSAAYAVPLGRFGGLAWLVAAGALLPVTRRKEDPR